MLNRTHNRTSRVVFKTNNKMSKAEEKIVNILIELGYKKVEFKDRETYNEIVFQSFGFDNFKEQHKEICRILLGNRLMEFYYGSNLQSIYFRKLNKQ